MADQISFPEDLAEEEFDQDLDESEESEDFDYWNPMMMDPGAAAMLDPSAANFQGFFAPPMAMQQAAFPGAGQFHYYSLPPGLGNGHFPVSTWNCLPPNKYSSLSSQISTPFRYGIDTCFGFQEGPASVLSGPPSMFAGPEAEVREQDDG